MISPCKNICEYDPEAKLCIGCYRTEQEITRWDSMTDNERKNIMMRLQKRRKGQ